MTYDLFLSAFAVAGIGMLWRRLLKDNPGIGKFLTTHLSPVVAEALDCAFCFTFWISLAAALLFDPTHGWLPPLRIALHPALLLFAEIVAGWMILGVLTLTIRTFTEQLFRITGQLTCILKNHPLHKHD